MLFYLRLRLKLFANKIAVKGNSLPATRYSLFVIFDVYIKSILPMAILKFRIYFEEDDSVYRDVVIRHKQTFFDLHETILKAYEFDTKHAATFFRSNDLWLRGREISLDVYDRKYKAPPLLMKETAIGTEIREPNQKFVYLYDFVKGWSFLVELINVTKEESPKVTYPSVVRKEGIPPSQYGTKSLLGERFADIEEKYDLSKGAEGFGVEGEDGSGAGDAEAESGDDDVDNSEESGSEEERF
jgi:hypothetical protein